MESEMSSQFQDMGEKIKKSQEKQNIEMEVELDSIQEGRV
jgi:hypothetical protein